ncbi:OVARIAN TUMOR DOMAIN-containing deubiquitinating enzyme 4-like [Rutidosis leptorrhynchoides]|uniref:OVARIAN TUMOR DOMAIN-containing deubiquitinating enzyme 4-like n=1 Tax=Rutidosis leptorrhynchoides TaxID=125765 RepID=UPI003A99EAFB
MISCAKYVHRSIGPRQTVMPQSLSSSCCFRLPLECVKPSYVTKTNGQHAFISSQLANQRSNLQSLTIKTAMRLRRGSQKTWFDLSGGSRNTSLRVMLPKQSIISRMKWSLVPGSWIQSCTAAGFVLGLSVCNSSSEPVHAEMKKNKGDECSSSVTNSSHGKQVHTDYSVIGIPGDGRCLFRAVAHGACLRSGKPAPNESLQRELADELRANVADEFVKRREETEWFIEGDFDSYVSQIRKTHVWGGEPELLMASHVLKMPITVYMNDKDSGGLISIAEYGHEYSKEDPIKVLYHGFGHYDALHIPGKKDSRSRL